MVRLVALWGVLLASLILALVLREEHLSSRGKIPLGRLRRLWLQPERRRTPRYRVSWTVRYCRLENQPEVAGYTRDVSSTGAGLVVQERLPVGSALEMELNVPSRPAPFRVSAHVVWTKEVPSRDAEPNATRNFFVGVQFHPLEPEAAEELAAFLKGNAQVPFRPDPSRAQVYARMKRGLWLLDLALSLGLVAAALTTGLAQWTSAWVMNLVAFWPLQTALYLGLLWAAGTLILFPLEWVRSFLIEQRFGLSTQRFPEWLKDYGKQLGVGAALGLILVEGLSLLLRASPDFWWIWAALLWLGWSVLLTRAAPTLLIPLFYRQRPLEDPLLQKKLAELLERCRTPVRGIFEVNLSRTTRKANACLCGWGETRRVLLSDTLLAWNAPDQVEVVLAHEVGHHRLRHIGLLTLSSAAALGFSCFLVARWTERAMSPFGLWGLEDPATLLLIGLGLSLAQLALLPVTNGLSRKLEAQADRFALEKTGNPGAFISAMRRLAEQNVAELQPPRWVEWLLYDHPAVGRRIAMAERFEAHHG